MTRTWRISGAISLLAVTATAGCGTFRPTPWAPVRQVEIGGSELAAADGFYADAQRAILARDYGRALDLLQLARRGHEKDPRILNAFGVVYDKLGRFDLSARYYAEALAVDPQSWIIQSNQAYSQQLQRNWAGQSETKLAEIAPAAPAAAQSPVASMASKPASPVPAAPVTTRTSSISAPPAQEGLRPTPAAPPARETPPQPNAGRGVAALATVAARSPEERGPALAPAARVVASRRPGEAMVPAPVTPSRHDQRASTEPRPYAVTFGDLANPAAPPAREAPSPKPNAGGGVSALALAAARSPENRGPALAPAGEARVRAPATPSPHDQWAPTGPRPYAVAFRDFATPASTAPPTRLAKAPQPASPPSVILLDTSGQVAHALRLRARLAQLGWSTAPGVRAAAPPVPRTVIRYPVWRTRVAQALARTLPGGAELQTCGRACRVIEVRLGADISRWRAEASRRLREG